MLRSLLYVHFIALAVFSLAACGEPSVHQEPRASEAVDESAVFRRRLEQWRELPEQARAPEVLSLVDGLPAGFYSRQELSAGTLIEELVGEDQVALLRYLDANLHRVSDGATKRLVLYASLIYTPMSATRTLELREELSKTHPESSYLAPFRPGGIEELLAVLEDAGRPVQERVVSARQLGRFGGKDVLDRLRAHADDPTPYAFGYGELPGDKETLAEHVVGAILRIEGRQ